MIARVDDKRRRARHGAIAVVLVLALNASAAADDRLPVRSTISGFVHATWKEREGLPGGAIYEMTQTADGYLWMGTAGGLLRFDGQQFVRWTPFGRPDAIAGAVTTVQTGRDGALWIGLVNGRIGRIVGGGIEYLPHDPSISGNAYTIVDAADGTVWLYDEPFALRRFVNGAWRDFHDDPLSNQIHGVFEDSGGRIWIGTDRGAARWVANENRFELVGPSKVVHSVSEDQQGRILAVSLNSVDIVDGPDRGVSIALPRQVLPQVSHVDKAGNLWIGTIDAGLFRIVNVAARPTLEHFAKAEGLTSDVVLGIFEDREGNVWVAGSNGLNRFRERKVQSLSSLSYRSSVLGIALLATPDGSVWVGTSVGLVLFDTNGDAIAERETLLPTNGVYAMGEDAAGPIIGLRGGQLAQFANRSAAPTLFEIPNAVAASAIARQRNGRFWLADRSGGVIRWTPDGSSPSDRVEGQRVANAILVDDRDRVWIGFADGALAAFAGADERIYTSADGLSGAAIRAIYQDRDGTLWAGTDRGLARFDGLRFLTFTRANGLPADSISSIIEDLDGNFWLGTNTGLVRIDRAAVPRIDASPPPRLAVTIYDANDGLAGMPAHYGNPGVTRTRDGRLWFLTQSGIAIVDPGRKSPPRPPPPVHIEAMVADDIALDLTAPLLLPARTRTLSIDYAAPDLSVPEKVQFRYTLEGLEDVWHDAGARRQAFYNDLPPGSYRFRVMARNNEGVWNEVGAAATFRVQPAFYQTLGFRLASLVTLVLAAWGLHRARLWQIARRLRAQFEARAAERTHIATELHDTLIQDLAALSLQAEVAEDQLPSEPLAAKATVDALRARLQEVVSRGRAGMTELRFGLVGADDLANALSRAAQELRQSDTGAFHLVVQGQPRPLHPVVGDEVCRIAREAIGNAFRHAGAERIDVELSFGHDELRVIVHDDGCGVVPEVLEHGRGGHLGLHLMRDRAKRLGATFKIWSRPQNGTEVVLAVPARTAFQPVSRGEARHAAEV